MTAMHTNHLRLEGNMQTTRSFRRMSAASGAIVLGMAIWLGSGVATQAATFTTFDPPNSGKTIATSINVHGAITGFFEDQNENEACYLRAADGTFTTFAPRHSITCDALSINAKGHIAGFWEDSDHVIEGFERLPGGKIEKFIEGDTTEAVAINVHQDITGIASDDKGTHGILETDTGITTFDAPGAIETQPTDINDNGFITGNWVDANDGEHAFVRDPTGVVTEFDGPGAIDTFANSINGTGSIAGTYIDSNHVGHGYIRATDGSLTIFDPKGSVDTDAVAINNKGAVTGHYLSSSGVLHGFVRSAGGKITSFDPPGSTDTQPSSINGQNAITGIYADGAGIVHGFLRTP